MEREKEIVNCISVSGRVCTVCTEQCQFEEATGLAGESRGFKELEWDGQEGGGGGRFIGSLIGAIGTQRGGIQKGTFSSRAKRYVEFRRVQMEFTRRVKFPHSGRAHGTYFHKSNKKVASLDKFHFL